MKQAGGATITGLNASDPAALIPVMKPWLDEAEAQAAAEVVLSGWVAQGPRVAEFERAVARRLGAEHGIAVSSCTTGLHLALLAAGVGPGDDVIVPSLSFIATANAVRYCGATPVFADVDPGTLNLTPQTIESAWTPRTVAVLLVHQAGTPADVDAVAAFCARRGVALIEDAACAIGSTYRGRPIGAHSDLAVLSFHPRKIITTGEGGMILTNREDFAVRLRRLREHAMSVSAAQRHELRRPVLERYLELGYNYRMTDVQAAIGLAQLEKLDAIVARRRERASRYIAAFADMPGLQTAADPPYGTTNFQSFWILPDGRYRISQEEFLSRLLDAGISARRGIMAAHREPAYAGMASCALPVTDTVTTRSIILPLFHAMTDGEQERVITAVRDVLREACR
jgi:dTDP-4-amino-4,6-dideoxygalactose transaminase